MDGAPDQLASVETEGVGGHPPAVMIVVPCSVVNQSHISKSRCGAPSSVVRK